MKTAKSTGLVAAAFLFAAVCDYAFGAGMAWLLTPEEYGVLSVALTYFLLLSFFIASGFPVSIAKLLSEDGRPAPGLMRFAVIGNFLLALVVVGGFVALTFHGPLSPGPAYGRLTLAVAAAALVLSVASTFHFALQGRMRFGAFGLLHASKSLNKLVFGMGFVLLGFGLWGAVSGLVAGAVFLLIASVFVFRRTKQEGEPRPFGPEERRLLLRYTGGVFIGSLALTLLTSLDLLAVKYLAPGGATNLQAAYYQSASILTKAPLWLVIASLSVLFPLVSRAAASPDPTAADRLLARVLRWTVIALAPLAILLSVFPAEVLALVFPPAYAEAAPALAIAAPGMAALSLCFVLTRSLQATGRAKAPGVFMGVTTALMVALLAVLVPRWGPVGAAASLTIACGAGALASGIAAMRAFHLRVRPERVVALALSLAAPVAVMWALAPADRVDTLVALIAAGLAYVAMLPLTGLITREERQAMLRAVRPEPDAGGSDA